MTTNTTPGAGPVTHSPLPDWCELPLRHREVQAGSHTIPGDVVCASRSQYGEPFKFADAGGAFHEDRRKVANFIVEACNSHARLLADREKLRKALEEAEGALAYAIKYPKAMDNEGFHHEAIQIAIAARAALKETEEQ